MARPPCLLVGAGRDVPNWRRPTYANAAFVFYADPKLESTLHLEGLTVGIGA
jgi:hypothetical protein